jgi:hypothetical protein
MCRGLFAVQDAGMSEAAVEAALKDCADGGYHGGMPKGATLTLEEAAKRFEAGETAFLEALKDEPFFVQLKRVGVARVVGNSCSRRRR